MKENGQIIKIQGNYATVRIGRHSACGSCGQCGMSEKQRHVDFRVQNTLDAQTGDVVEIDIKETNTVKFAAVAYVLPLVFGVLAFFVGVWLSFPDWADLLMFLGGTAAAFALTALIDKKKNHKWINMPEMVKIVKEDIGGEKNEQSNGTEQG